jgi:hypothetical protein
MHPLNIRSQLCHSGYVMLLLLVIIGFIVLVASLVADYKWRQWMAARKAERDRQ